MTLKNLDLSILKNQDISILNQPIKTKRNHGFESEEFEYLYIGNIPSFFRSADLRRFFKDFVENQAFKCFHFRHRPEKQVVVDKCTSKVECDNVQSENVKSKKDEKKLNLMKKELLSMNKDNETCCCIIKIYKKHAYQFIQKFKGKEWRFKDGSFAKRTVNINRLKVKTKPNKESTYESIKELKTEKHRDCQEVYIEDLEISIELNPPEYIMPYGNVGTTTKYFLGLIKECKMPPSLIKSLALEFPRTWKNKAYSNVPLDYGVSCQERNKLISCTAFKPDNDKLSLISIGSQDDDQGREFGEKQDHSDSKQYGTSSSSNVQSSCCVEPISEMAGEEDDAEDWERYESLHDDIDNQSRPKERLFEEDIELKWEKGGSGLVFYTDAYFWNELKGKDFDEDTVDDWDVDYSIYYEDGAGDKPARDQYMMRMEQRLREGSDPIKSSQLRRKEKYNHKQMTTNFGEFEKYSKGFGSRILKEQGWVEGSGVGMSSEGIAEPLSLEGQGPSNRVGLGYYGEKLDRTVNLKRKLKRDIQISTKYDKKDE